MFSVQTCTDLIARLLPEPHAGLLSGILFGAKASLSPDLKEQLIRTGTLHMVALSGMNITLIAQLVNGILIGVVGRRIAVVITIASIVVFIWFVGPSPSVVRAGCMGSISLIGILTGRRVIALWSWGLTMILMLALSWSLIGDSSFQLSGLSSLGLILFGRADPPSATNHSPLIGANLYSRLRGWVADSFTPFLYRELHTTLAAQVLTLPVLLFTFGRISFISPVANILVVWLIPILTVWGMITVAAGFLWLPFGRVLALACWVVLEYMVQVIRWLGMLPFAAISR